MHHACIYTVINQHNYITIIIRSLNYTKDCDTYIRLKVSFRVIYNSKVKLKIYYVVR